MIDAPPEPPPESRRSAGSSPSSSDGSNVASKPSKRHGLIASFGFALAGISYLLRTQRNARIHAALGVAACCLAVWLRIPRTDFAILVLTIASVLILEGLNTALEAAVDLASPQIHPLAKTAKDVSAGMVLIAAIASVIVGLFLLGRPLLHKMGL